MAKIEINLKYGMGSILVDGVPIRGVNRVEILSVPAHPAIVKLSVLATSLELIEADASVEKIPIVADQKPKANSQEPR